MVTLPLDSEDTTLEPNKEQDETTISALVAPYGRWTPNLEPGTETGL